MLSATLNSGGALGLNRSNKSVPKEAWLELERRVRKLGLTGCVVRVVDGALPAGHCDTMNGRFLVDSNHITSTL